MGINNMDIDSNVFELAGPMPSVYTCEGENISPPLNFKNVPAHAKSLVLIMDDPDAPDPKAPKMTWDHWLLYNMPSTTKGLPEKVATNHLPAGTLLGLNSWKATGYGGPCPPIGSHRYYFKLYALDVMLPDLHQPNKTQLLKAMEGHVVSEAQWMGTYQKHSTK
jgi:Raf kinase inhibitor-like YbhB/YbcL family protein